MSEYNTSEIKQKIDESIDNILRTIFTFDFESLREHPVITKDEVNDLFNARFKLEYMKNQLHLKYKDRLDYVKEYADKSNQDALLTYSLCKKRLETLKKNHSDQLSEQILNLKL